MGKFFNKFNTISRVVICCIVLQLFVRAEAQDRVTGHTFATRSEIIAAHGMAATSQPLATQVCLDILKQGGNAIELCSDWWSQ